MQNNTVADEDIDQFFSSLFENLPSLYKKVEVEQVTCKVNLDILEK